MLTDGSRVPVKKLADEFISIWAALRDKEKYADWANSAQIRALTQADIILILAKHGYPPTPPEIYEKVCSGVQEQAENFNKYSN